MEKSGVSRLMDTERDDLELKLVLDPRVQRDRLRLVKEIVAMANTKGGRILVGVADDGERVGIPEGDRVNWDGALLGDLVEKYIVPDRVEVGIAFRRGGCASGRMVVELTVPQHGDPPLVVSKDGTEGSKTFFRKGAVLVRNNTKVELASRSDFVRWKKEDRKQVFDGVKEILLSPGATVQIIQGDERVDTASYFLSRSVDLFRRRPDKLLDGTDLLYLFQNRDYLDTASSDGRRLLIHSSLRRQPTLWFWLALLGTGADEVFHIVHEALRMKDRDKSDMSKAVALVGCLFLTPAQYQGLVSEMQTSRYAHIQRAADTYAEPSEAKAAIDKRRQMLVDGRRLSEFNDDELLTRADLEIEGGQPRYISRRLPALGLEYLSRRVPDE